MPSVFDGFRPRRPMFHRPKLSSEMVRPVLQRVSTRMDTFTSDNEKATQQRFLGFSLPPMDPPARSTSKSFTSSVFGSYRHQEPEVAPQYRDNAPASASLRCQSTSSDDAIAMTVTCANHQPSDMELERPRHKPKRVRLQTDRRRKQCRANQARYRQKQLTHNKRLAYTVQVLRSEIPVLELQRSRLKYGDQQDVWNVVVEYFHNFRFGALMTLPEAGPHKTNFEIEYRENEDTKRQLSFLRSSVTENVILGERSGVEALMKQWLLYSLSFQNLYFQLERIERKTDHFVSVTAVLNVTVSEETFRGVFVHLSPGDSNENEAGASKAASLRSSMIRQRLLLPCSLCFEWDASIGRVVRLETTVNFMKPLMMLLGNLSDVAMVLDGARITRDGAVGIRDA